KVIEAQEIPALINRLRDVAAESGTEVLDKNSVLSAYAILAQTRSVAVDLMIVCGMSRESAVAQLKPTSKTPAFPPAAYGAVSSRRARPVNRAGAGKTSNASRDASR